MARAMEIRTLLAAGVLAAATTAANPALAQSASDTLVVQATVGGECSVTGATLDFGSYNGVQKDVEVPISFECSTPSNISVSLDGGQNGDPVARQMSHTVDPGNPPLLYQLFQNQGRNSVWGVFPADSRAFPAARAETPTVFGRILGGQNTVVPGTYRDVVQITLTAN